jgi:acyl-CoA thioester hydrolase
MADANDGVLDNGVYRFRLTVPREAIDMLGHANNAEYVRWMEMAAVRHSERVGYDMQAYRALGTVFVIRRQNIEYLRPAREGQVLQIATWVASMAASTTVRATEISDENGTTMLKAETTWVYVSLSTMRPERIPDDMRERFGAPPA